MMSHLGGHRTVKLSNEGGFSLSHLFKIDADLPFRLKDGLEIGDIFEVFFSSYIFYKNKVISQGGSSYSLHTYLSECRVHSCS